jgi:hypothetical protein
MSYQFHIGQKVVYIYEGPRDLRYGERAPIKGQIYTIRGFPDAEAMFLEEIVNKPNVYTDNGKLITREKGWFRSSFRPLIKTDISIFEAMLVPVNGKVEA